ncbi:MAG: hypothetical protein HYV97_03770 [Bdellovibrio sp.]|nr:hypothetical protein [Bdellovibrio sp.]
MSRHSAFAHQRMTPREIPDSVEYLARVEHKRNIALVPVEKAGAIKMVVFVAVACADVALAIGGIYLYGAYRHAVDKIADRMKRN